MKHRIATHAIAIAAGVALAASFASQHSAFSAASTTEDANTANPAPSRDSRTDRSSVVRKPHAEEFKAAWDAIPSKSLPMTERIGLQRKLLEKWAELDLQGALDAAMAEAWDNDFNPGFEMIGTSGHSLMDPFRKAFIDRPLDSWALINSGRYGVGSAILRGQWVTSVSTSDAPMVISMLGEMPNGLREFAVERAMDSSATNPGMQAAVLAKLMEYPDGEDAERWLKKAATSLRSDGDPVALREQWSSLSSGPQRTITMMQWGASLKQADDAALREEWTHVPEAERPAALAALFAPAAFDSRSLFTMLDLAKDAGQWTLLSKEGQDALLFLNGTGEDPVKLATWATTLPERPETVELFHRSVDRYIREDMPRAKEWLEQMQPGDWHRERGLAEYSQQALRSHNDRDASRWALDQISDPDLKEKAEGWRRDWEREKGVSN